MLRHVPQTLVAEVMSLPNTKRSQDVLTRFRTAIEAELDGGWLPETMLAGHIVIYAAAPFVFKMVQNMPPTYQSPWAVSVMLALTASVIDDPEEVAKAFSAPNWNNDSPIVEAALHHNLYASLVLMLNTHEASWPTCSSIERFYTGQGIEPAISVAILTGSKEPLRRYAQEVRIVRPHHMAIKVAEEDCRLREEEVRRQARVKQALVILMAAVKRWASANGGRGEFALAGDDGVIKTMVLPVLAAAAEEIKRARRGALMTSAVHVAEYARTWTLM